MNSKKILDSLFVDNQERTLEQRAKMVKDVANSFKYIPQTVSVMTITVILIGLVAQFFNVSKGTDLYFIILAIGGVLGLILGFKLERSIETFFTYPIQILKEKKVKENLASFIVTSITCLLLIALSLFLSLGGKKQAVASSVSFTPTDVTSSITNIVNSMQIKENTSDKVKICQDNINIKYDRLVRDSRNKANRASKKSDRIWLSVGNITKLEKLREKALKECSNQYDSEYKASAETSRNAAIIANRLIDKVEKDDETMQKIVAAKSNSYSFYLGNIIWISMPLSLLLYIVKVLNEKKVKKTFENVGSQKSKKSVKNTPTLSQNVSLINPQSTDNQSVKKVSKASKIVKEDYRKYYKNAKGNYSVYVKTGSKKSKETAIKYAEILKSFGFDYSLTATSIDIDSFKNPTLL